MCSMKTSNGTTSLLLAVRSVAAQRERTLARMLYVTKCFLNDFPCARKLLINNKQNVAVWHYAGARHERL